MVQFEFNFKGNRTYIQGGDIYNVLSSFIHDRFGESVTDLSLSFHRLCSRNLDAVIQDDASAKPPEEAVALCRFVAGGEARQIYLTESDRDVTSRKEYDEALITSPSRIDLAARTVTLDDPTPFTPVEIIIALNKLLMQTIFSDKSGKWLFTQLRVSRPLPLDVDGRFEISLKRDLGTRFTCSSIRIGGELVGDIYFSMIEV